MRRGRGGRGSFSSMVPTGRRARWWYGARLWPMTMSLVMAGSFVPSVPQELLAQELATADTVRAAKSTQLVVGRSSVLLFDEPIDRASINDTKIADVVAVSPTQLLVHAKQPGSTSLIVWHAAGNEVFTVTVEADLEALQQTLRRVLSSEPIEVHSSLGTAILSGEVSSKEATDEAFSIAKTYSEQVVNLLHVRRKPLQEVLASLFPIESIAVNESPDGVILTGEVSSQEVIDHAAQVAQSYSPKVTNFLSRKSNFASVLQKLLPDEKLTVFETKDTIILSGKASHPANAAKAVQAAAASAEHVVNLVDVPDRKQVLLEVRFAEANRSVAKAIGFDYILQGQSFTQSGFVGGALNPQLPSTPQFTRISATDLAVSSLTNQLFELRKGTDISVALKALEKKGLIRILAEPNLLTMSGEEATFLAGGEFPIPVVQSATSGGNNAVTIEFKEFGIRLNFKPEVTSDDTITMLVEPEVSVLDFSTAAVRIGGFSVPGLVTRRARTNVQLRSDESLVIGGLLSQLDNRTDAHIPFLGKIPVLGQLFSSDEFKREETELLVLVTPRLTKPTVMDVPPAFPKPEDVAQTLKKQIAPVPYPDQKSDALRDAIRQADPAAPAPGNEVKPDQVKSDQQPTVPIAVVEPTASQPAVPVASEKTAAPEQPAATPEASVEPAKDWSSSGDQSHTSVPAPSSSMKSRRFFGWWRKMFGLEKYNQPNQGQVSVSVEQPPLVDTVLDQPVISLVEPAAAEPTTSRSDVRVPVTSEQAIAPEQPVVALEVLPEPAQGTGSSVDHSDASAPTPSSATKSKRAFGWWRKMFGLEKYNRQPTVPIAVVEPTASQPAVPVASEKTAAPEQPAATPEMLAAIPEVPVEPAKDSGGPGDQSDTSVPAPSSSMKSRRPFGWWRKMFGLEKYNQPDQGQASVSVEQPSAGISSTEPMITLGEPVIVTPATDETIAKQAEEKRVLEQIISSEVPMSQVEQPKADVVAPVVDKTDQTVVKQETPKKKRIDAASMNEEDRGKLSTGEPVLDWWKVPVQTPPVTSTGGQSALSNSSLKNIALLPAQETAGQSINGQVAMAVSSRVSAPASSNASMTAPQSSEPNIREYVNEHGERIVSLEMPGADTTDAAAGTAPASSSRSSTQTDWRVRRWGGRISYK